ncbi:MAG: hypothetical protein GXO50_03545 [Chlorobi bacterium]|nr:hypothetical protein [Chlorobiota bacterium]
MTLGIKKISIITLSAIFISSVIFLIIENKNTNIPENPNIPYSLSEPDKTYRLTEELKEISGLTVSGKQKLACIQDEKGIIYLFNLNTGKTEQKIHFAGKGDFEALEIIKNNMWAVKSNGTLYEIKNIFSKNKRKIVKHKTFLTEKNNIEGLCADSNSENLLIACKGYPFPKNKKHKKYKAVYKFNIKTEKLEPSPFLLINTDSVKKYQNYNHAAKLGLKSLNLINLPDGDISFQPSGIAIHPISKNIYITASVGKSLIILSPKGKILSVTKLDKKIFPQPEGICFDSVGTLFISNEGKNKKATILKFSPKK